MGTISKKGIMLVTDPKETLTALCNIKSEKITWNSFKKAYENEIDRTDDPIASQTADTHFYSLRIFKLITQYKKGEYRATQLALDLCKAIADEDIISYQQILREAILESEKGDLFCEFLQKLDSSKLSEEELGKFYKHRILITLIAWSRYAGLISGDSNGYWKIKIIKKIPSTKLFLETIRNVYGKMNRTEIFTVKRIYVNIGELRDTVSAKLGITRQDFNNYLTKSLETKITHIRLHGSPPLYSDRELSTETFRFKGKIYHYLSLE